MDSSAIKNAIEYVFDHVKKSQEPNIFVSPTGRLYAKDRLIEINDDPVVEPIQAHTLDSLIDYILESPEELEDHITIQVTSPTRVVAFSAPRYSDAKRNVYFEATALLPQFKYDYYYDQEDFVLKLRSCFAKKGDVESLIFAASNLASVNEQNFSDDGISQQAVINTGIVSKERALLPASPVLYPYRTFMEIDQPGSPFIFLAKNSDDGPMLKLEEADGGSWRLEAMAAIKEYLQFKIESMLSAGKYNSEKYKDVKDKKIRISIIA